MLRAILTAVGLIEILAPKRGIEAAEGIALENTDACELKSWIVPVTRGGGLLYLLLARRGDSSYATFKQFLGVVGLLALLSPRLFIDYAARIAYTDPERCEWKPWCYPLARFVGVLYLLVALDERRKR